ncbi:hypothetical protein SERLADRAFT_385702, partial [Serpula lacrymans var. lacrymans S7.9]
MLPDVWAILAPSLDGIIPCIRRQLALFYLEQGGRNQALGGTVPILVTLRGLHRCCRR